MGQEEGGAGSKGEHSFVLLQPYSKGILDAKVLAVYTPSDLFDWSGPFCSQWRWHHEEEHRRMEEVDHSQQSAPPRVGGTCLAGGEHILYSGSCLCNQAELAESGAWALVHFVCVFSPGCSCVLRCAAWNNWRLEGGWFTRLALSTP